MQKGKRPPPSSPAVCAKPFIVVLLTRQIITVKQAKNATHSDTEGSPLPPPTQAATARQCKPGQAVVRQGARLQREGFDQGNGLPGATRAQSRCLHSRFACARTGGMEFQDPPCEVLLVENKRMQSGQCFTVWVGFRTGVSTRWRKWVSGAAQAKREPSAHGNSAATRLCCSHLFVPYE